MGFAGSAQPTVLFVNGREIARQAGAMDSASIQRWIAAGLQKAGR